MTIPMLWPVYGFRNGLREDVAVCLDYYDAVDMVNASERNLYIAEPSYDRREEQLTETHGDPLLKRRVAA